MLWRCKPRLNSVIALRLAVGHAVASSAVADAPLY
jgi:hypothetical protein